MKIQNAKFMTRCASYLFLGTALAGAVVLTGLQTSANAQATPSPLEDLRTKDSGSDFFGNGGGNPGSSMMNFIQNAILGTPRSSEEFVSDQRDNLDEATVNFRKQQQEKLRKQTTSTSPTLEVLPFGTTPTEPSAGN